MTCSPAPSPREATHSARCAEDSIRTVRHSRFGGIPALGFAGSFLLSSAIVAAVPGSFDRPSGLERLQPDCPALAVWNLDAGAERNLDEAELVLSLDGGATYPVRLTGRIAPGARSATWRVPSLPTGRARIALRAGMDEQAGAERILFVSEPFAIESAGSLPHEDLFAVNDEWRTREALEGAPARPPSPRLRPSEPDLELDTREADDADDPGPDKPLASLHVSDDGALAPSIRPWAANGSHRPSPEALRHAVAPLRL